MFSLDSYGIIDGVNTVFGLLAATRALACLTKAWGYYNSACESNKKLQVLEAHFVEAIRDPRMGMAAAFIGIPARLELEKFKFNRAMSASTLCGGGLLFFGAYRSYQSVVNGDAVGLVAGTINTVNAATYLLNR